MKRMTREQRRRLRVKLYGIFVAVVFVAFAALLAVAIRYGIYVQRLVKEYAESPYGGAQVVTMPENFDEDAFKWACTRYELEKDAALYLQLRR